MAYGNIKIRIIFFAVTFCVFFGAAKVSQAATYYVAASGGDDGYDGSAIAHTSGSVGPWATFAHSIATLQPGDKLIIESSDNYTEPLVINKSGTAGHYITVQSQGYAAGGDPPADGDVTITTGNEASPCSIGDFPNTVSYVELDGVVCRETGAVNGTNGNRHALSIGGNGNLGTYNTYNIVRRVSAYGASGSNSFNINLTYVDHSLLEDVAASGQGRINLNALSVTNTTFRRVWMNWTGPSTGGGDTSGLNQIYDASNDTVENCYGTSTTNGASIGGMGVWAHYGSSGGNQFLGNISYFPSTQNVEAYGDDAECGQTTTGTIIKDNVSLNLYHGVGFREVLGNSSDGTRFTNNTLVGDGAASNDQENKGIFLGNRLGCSQAASMAYVYSNSFVHLTNAFQGSNANNHLLARDYNNLYDIYEECYDPAGSDPYSCGSTNGEIPARGENEKILNPAYDTATYGNGAYLFPPTALKGIGQGGADIGADAIHRYVDGALTSMPLWPWPMEARIVSEIGVSPTWAANGGLWKTLSGVYSSDTVPPVAPSGLSVA